MVPSNRVFAELLMLRHSQHGSDTLQKGYTTLSDQHTDLLHTYNVHIVMITTSGDIIQTYEKCFSVVPKNLIPLLPLAAHRFMSISISNFAHHF